MSSSILDHKKVLAVDDELDILNVLEEETTSKCSGFTLDKATSYDEAVKLIQSNSYDLIVLDIMGVRGFDLLDIAIKNDLKVVMLTAHALSPENLKRAHDIGARAYLPKQKLGDIVPFLEDALKCDFESGWERVYKGLRDIFGAVWGGDWEILEKEVGAKLPRGDGSRT